MFYNWKTVLVTISLLFVLKVQSPYIIENIQWSWFDWLHQQHEVENIPEIVLVNIDEASIEKYGQYPWPRNIYSDILFGTDPTNTHVFTQIFSEPDRFGGDELFAEGLINRLSVLAAAPTTQTITGSAPFVGTATLGGGEAGDYVWNFPGIVAPLDILQNNTYGVGVANATPNLPGTPNFDATVRSAPLLVQANGELYPSLALETIRAFFDEQSYQLRVTPDVGVEWVRMGRQPPINTTPTGDVMVSYWHEFPTVSASEIMNTRLEGKVLIWGLTAEGFNNPVSTPVGAMFPNEVQANLLQTILGGVQIQQSLFYELLELIVLLAVMLKVLAVVQFAPTRYAFVGSMVLIGGQIYGGFYLWDNYLILFDTLYSSIASFIVFGHASFNKYYVTYKLKEQIKKQFGTYVSPDLVKQLQDNPSLLKLGGERREMTFMFMDICGFTPISEHYKNNDDPEGLVELVNEFLNDMTTIILDHGGTIDKYMGDCIMAFWNAPLDCPNHAEQACLTAIEVEKKVDELKALYKERGLPDINVGTGINTGTCIVGNMGSETRFDYSVIGDAVNLAARLEATAARHEYIDYKTIVSSMTMEALPKGWDAKEIGRIKVKGKEDTITIYSLPFQF
tara:strand:+ start:6880 stop:8742 length:1863 start_codon:yes stop_codon:yes gene_type:complete